MCPVGTLLNQNQQMINAYNRPRSTNCGVVADSGEVGRAFRLMSAA
jgi:hypothetical protein